jgi:GTPase SAR1 family protein
MDEKELLEIIERAARKESTDLVLSRMEIRSLPADVGKLTKLMRLYLNNNQLSSLPVEIGKLTNLTVLNLSKNHLSSLPVEMGKLTNLRGLWVNGNQLTLLPAEIGKLTNLIVLDLSMNQLMSLPADIGNLTNLSVLILYENQLSSLPAEIGQLKDIREFDLSSNRLNLLPREVGNLTALSRLFVRDNQLISLPAELGDLKNLTRLVLEGNPFESPPEPVLRQGTGAILAYLRELREGERQEWLSKLLFVGEGGVGKTSLLKRLRGEDFDPQEKTTHGLKIRTLELDHPKRVGVTMCLNAWDFGGQYVLHSTHQFFLTKRSLFVLVWNARHGWQQGKLYYWLDVVKARAPESPVLIVATHTEEWPGELPYEEIRNKYPQVRGYFSVSNERKTGIDEVKEAIRHEAASLPLMGERWPATWLNMAESVRELRKRKKYIYPNELDELMRDKQVKKENHGVLSTWLHDLGDILYFKDNPDLSDIVILDAEWVGSNISCMLEDAKIEKGLGIFKREHMEAVWPKVEPPIREVFLRLMEQFDLSFRTLENKDISIVVERLSLDSSGSAKGYEEIWDSRKGESEIMMNFYLNTSLPPGIPTWFIARSHRFTTYKHWRYGALFVDGEKRKHFGLVRAYDHDRYLTLSVRGPAPQNFFALLRDGLELTFKRYPGLDIERKIPCPGHTEQYCPYEFDLMLVEKALEKGKPTVECHQSGNDVQISQLLYGFDLKPESAVMLRLERLWEKIVENSMATRQVVIGRVDALEEELVRDLGVILTELVELRGLSEREFLRLFNQEQELEKSHCPNVFTVLPKEGRLWLKDILGQKMVLQLCCQAPGQWHPALKGGRYEIREPAVWLKSMGPYILKLAKIIKYAAPLVGPIAGIVSREYAEDFKHQLKLMEELAKKLKEKKNFKEMELAESIGGVERAEHVEGAELRALRKLLDEVDTQQNWGGLKKVLTPEGHWLWLCEQHAQEYKR